MQRNTGTAKNPPVPGRAQIHQRRRLCRLVVALALVGVAWSLLVPRATHGQGAAGDSWSRDTDATIYSVAGSADGGTLLAGRRDNVVAAFDAAGKTLWEAKTNGSMYGVAISDDGQRSAAASEDRNVYYFDGSGQPLWTQRGSQTFTSVAISKDGGIVAAGSEDRQVYLFDRSGTLRWNYAAADAVTAVAIYGSEGGFRVLAGSRDSRVHLLSGDGQLLWQARLSYAVSGLGVTPDGRHVAVGGRGNTVYLLDGITGNRTWTFNAGSQVQGVGISGDGQVVAAGTEAGEVIILGASGGIIQRQQFDNAVNGIAVTRGRPDLVVGAGSVLTYAAGGGATYGFARPPSRVVPITLGVLAVLLVLGAAIGLRPTRSGERAWKGYHRASRSVGRQVWRSRVSYLFLIPTISLLIVFNYYPAISGIVHAFSVWKPGVSTEWVGFENFRVLRGDRYFWIGTLNALLLIVTGFLKLILPLLVAELIFHLRNDLLRYAMRTLFVLPLVVPGVVGILLWVNIYDPNIGLANQTLRAIGLENWTRVWLGDEDTALWAIIFMGFPWISAFALLIFYGGLISIPHELFDAAKVDGASGLRTFWSIHIPLLMGQFRLLLILGFISGVQEFSAVFLTTGGGPGSATYVPALELYYQAVRFNNFGLASAIGAVLFLVIMAGTIINMRYVKSAVEYTA